MFASDVRGPLFDHRPGQKVFSIFPPDTFGAQRKITYPMARSTSVSKKGSCNDKIEIEGQILNGGSGVCGNVRCNTPLYCLGFYSDVLEC